LGDLPNSAWFAKNLPHRAHYLGVDDGFTRQESS
jgi:hypothetical protein